MLVNLSRSVRWHTFKALHREYTLHEKMVNQHETGHWLR